MKMFGCKRACRRKICSLLLITRENDAHICVCQTRGVNTDGENKAGREACKPDAARRCLNGPHSLFQHPVYKYSLEAEQDVEITAVGGLMM